MSNEANAEVLKLQFFKWPHEAGSKIESIPITVWGMIYFLFLNNLLTKLY